MIAVKRIHSVLEIVVVGLCTGVDFVLWTFFWTSGASTTREWRHGAIEGWCWDGTAVDRGQSRCAEDKLK